MSVFPKRGARRGTATTNGFRSGTSGAAVGGAAVARGAAFRGAAVTRGAQVSEPLVQSDGR